MYHNIILCMLLHPAAHGGSSEGAAEGNTSTLCCLLFVLFVLFYFCVEQRSIPFRELHLRSSYSSDGVPAESTGKASIWRIAIHRRFSGH